MQPRLSRPGSLDAASTVAALVLAVMIPALGSCRGAPPPPVAQASPSQPPTRTLEEHGDPPKPPAGLLKSNERAVFTVFEGPRINVYARRLNATSTQEALLISEEALPNVRPMSAITARISPRGDRIAYMLRYPPGRNSPYGPVFLVDQESQGRTRLIEQAGDFFWSPEGTRILYSLPPSPTPPDYGSSGRRAEAFGYEWRLLDLTSGKEEVLAQEGHGFLSLAAWLDRRLVFSKSWSLVVFDLGTRRQVEPGKSLPFERGRLSTNPAGTRMLLITEASDFSACPIYEVMPGWRLGKKLVANLHHTCGALEWNTDDEVFYGKGTGPRGRISTSETTESGYYLLLSVYKYRFGTRTEHPVLESDGTEVYRFQGLLPGKAIVVSNESNARSPRHLLEARRLDGTHPVTLRSSEREMMLIGWLP